MTGCLVQRPRLSRTRVVARFGYDGKERRLARPRGAGVRVEAVGGTRSVGLIGQTRGEAELDSMHVDGSHAVVNKGKIDTPRCTTRRRRW